MANQNKELLKLDIGPGDWTAPNDWTSVDLVKRKARVDVIGSLLELPFEDESASRVYCGHVMEHILEEDLPRAFTEIHRVLVPNGVLMIVGPDIKKARRLHQPGSLIRSILASPRDEYLKSNGALHAWTCSAGKMSLYVVRNGFMCSEIPIKNVDSSLWPIDDRKAPWQFALECNPVYE